MSYQSTHRKILYCWGHIHVCVCVVGCVVAIVMNSWQVFVLGWLDINLYFKQKLNYKNIPRLS